MRPWVGPRRWSASGRCWRAAARSAGVPPGGAAAEPVTTGTSTSERRKALVAGAGIAAIYHEPDGACVVDVSIDEQQLRAVPIDVLLPANHTDKDTSGAWRSAADGVVDAAAVATTEEGHGRRVGAERAGSA